MEAIDLRGILNDTDMVLSRAYFVLVPTGYKRHRGNVFYIPVNNTLEAQFKIDISDFIVDSTVCVLEEMIDVLDVDKAEFIERAYENTRKMLPPKFDTISEILGIPEDMPMYVLTNEKQVFGAGTILYPGMKKKLESIIGEFIVIPSSVHEVILVPKFMVGPELTQIIREINESVVRDDEVLSDRPYILTDDRELLEV